LKSENWTVNLIARNGVFLREYYHQQVVMRFTALRFMDYQFLFFTVLTNILRGELCSSLKWCQCLTL